MTYYPLPSYAASVWTIGDFLHLGFPPITETDRGHSVKLDFNLAVLKNMIADKDLALDTDERRTLKSLFVMLSTLKEREHAREAMSIGKRSSPVQYDLEQIMKSFGGEITRVGPKKQAKESLSLEDLGL